MKTVHSPPPAAEDADKGARTRATATSRDVCAALAWRLVRRIGTRTVTAGLTLGIGAAPTRTTRPARTTGRWAG
ncbi:hypothetical protein GPA10_10775 [Streptomyces sp. p1417]|uniref:Uncharacterized protein n=1 Tax=Streptomyces typhae TaxID=2681492 RepID=A0A6L6WT42_9ACTN|nr:hypothetical protein [Streptomyces typhae]